MKNRERSQAIKIRGGKELTEVRKDNCDETRFTRKPI